MAFAGGDWSTIKPVLDGASKVNYSTGAENAAAGVEPDFIMGTDGQIRANPKKIAPNPDGSINIQMEGVGADGQSIQDKTEAMKSASENQKASIRELIRYFQKNNPNAQVPTEWLWQLEKQPDLPNPSSEPRRDTPAPQPQQQPQQNFEPQGPSGGSPGGGRRGGGSVPNFGGASRGGGDGRGAGYDEGGTYRSGTQPGDKASSGATPNADQQTVLNNVKVVVDVAKEKGVDPTLAVAMMLVESGGDNRAEGDKMKGRYTSFGLFQLHEGGMLTDAGLTREQAFDPRINAEVSLGNLAKIDHKYSDPGKAAAASQRPANPGDYARKVNASMDEAAELIRMSEQQGNGTATATAQTNKPRTGTTG